MISAVFFDFGGVILTSPFDAFEGYELASGLPIGLIRRLNTINPDDNAWARFERSEVDQTGFARLFESEAAAAGYRLDGAAVVAMLRGEVRPEMVRAVRRIKEAGLTVACLTNNFLPKSERSTGVPPNSRSAEVASIMGLFDHVIASSEIGVRKPEPGFYEEALRVTGAPPAEVVFLDDLGMNLKPARAMGMTTIKVTDPAQAIAELESVVGIPLT